MTNNQVNDFLDSIHNLRLYPLITKPNRITSHSATLVDNIFTNIHDYAHMSGIIVCLPVKKSLLMIVNRYP